MRLIHECDLYTNKYGVFLSKLFSFVLNPCTKQHNVIILNDITMLASILKEQQQAAYLSTTISMANINS